MKDGSTVDRPNGAFRLPSSPIFRAYEQARKRVSRDEHRDLTPKEFLDTVDPLGHRSRKSARDYMRRLETGKRSGRVIKKRADTGGGKIYNVALRDANGWIVDSANVEVPAGASTLDLYRGRGKTRLRRAVDEYMERRYRAIRPSELVKATQTGYVHRGSAKGLEVAGIRPIRKTTKTHVSIVRFRNG